MLQRTWVPRDLQPCGRYRKWYSPLVLPPQDKTTPAPGISPARDFYEILNASRKASSKEIRRAYRALARKYHPDFNPDDKAAELKFREVQEAYEVLGNSRKRKAYDYYGRDFSDRIPARASDPASPPAVSRPSPRPSPLPSRNAARPFATTHPYRSPGVFPRLASHARLGSLAVALVFVSGTIVYLWLPNSGIQEFTRAQEALRHVTSWKMEGRILGSDSASGEFLTEVNCSGEHTVQHIRPTSANSRELILETVVIGNDHYSYNDWAKHWTQDLRGGTGPSDTCTRLSRGEDAGRLPPLGQWLGGSYVIEKENLRETPGGSCREWKIVSPAGFSRSPDADFVCLGIKDHLPWLQGYPGNPQEIRFYDWNVPIDIQAPDLASAPR
jgi:hypothetical protein